NEDIPDQRGSRGDPGSRADRGRAALKGKQRHPTMIAPGDRGSGRRPEAAACRRRGTDCRELNCRAAWWSFAGHFTRVKRDGGKKPGRVYTPGYFLALMTRAT